ncbi:MAG: hypothetical protein OWU84_04885 [Firmicutes bacterium]|nr:hypothetical protein [Bacillota bacterium]
MNHREQLWLSGIIGTLLFFVTLALSPLFHLAPMRVPLWTGGFLTLNLGVASFLGYLLDFLIGVGLAWLYDQWRKGAVRRTVGHHLAFGTLLWLFMMIIGFPLFDLLSPLVQHGYFLGPGIFLWRLGFWAPVLWLAASLAYGLSVGYLLDVPLASFYR